MRWLPVLAAIPLLAQTTRDDRWRADIDLLFSTVQSRHPNLYTQTPKPDWDRAISALRENVPAAADVEIAMEMARILALARDGHMSLNLRTSPLFTFYQLRLGWFEEGWVITAASGDFPGLAGTVIKKFDDTPIDQVIDKLRAYVSYEHEWWFRSQVATYLVCPEILRAIGVEKTRGWITINDEFQIPSGPGTVWGGPINAQPKFPLWARSSGIYYWFTYVPESRAIYVKYSVCAEMPVLPAAKFRQELEAAMAANPVEGFIVDVRNNTGGDSGVLRRLLPDVPASIKRIAITGRQTFSSGLFGAQDLSAAGYALLGEPTGGKPTHFGQVVGITLASAGLRAQYSTRSWIRGPQPDSESLMPDVQVPWTWAAFAREEDPFLEAALLFQ
ncbi:MAG: hypothetical protein FJW38_30665 [Acidobacteria bacterium]|nr:hypothetical protein [Acidobacteriota bacterium]